MQTKSNRVKQEFFDEAAKNWEQHNYPKQTREKLAFVVASMNLREGYRVLDIGCGTGILVPYLREAVGSDGQIIEMDPSAKMLELAALKDGGKVFSVLARAEDIPLVDNHVDAVCAFSCFPHFDNPALAAGEFFRVLKPGKAAHVVHLADREELNRHHARFSAVRDDILPCSEKMSATFNDVGFTKVTIEEKPGWYHLIAFKPEEDSNA